MQQSKSNLSALQNRAIEIRLVCNELLKSKSPKEKVELLNKISTVSEFIAKQSNLQSFLDASSIEDQLIIKSILVIGQGQVIFRDLEDGKNVSKSISTVLEQLKETERFYDSIGGVLGYYCTALELIANKKSAPTNEKSNIQYHSPAGYDLDKPDQQLSTYVRAGVENLPLVGEVYPIGGAGDRLNLCHSTTKEPLPVAYLSFGGRTLIEGMVKDLQAKEYLYWKLMEKQIEVPIAMMTSKEKNNDARVKELLTEAQWFGRNPKNFMFFEQPLVPVILDSGDFSLIEPFKLMLKPGGHGALWKLALDGKILSWIESHGCKKILLRQINNPIASTDNGILAFTGIGCIKDKKFGIASCPRLVNASEGMIVLSETINPDDYTYTLLNIEYTDFCEKGIQDKPASENQPYSRFPANTNILFADIAKIREVAERNPIPGAVINLKHLMPSIDSDGKKNQLPGGRVESMMQNIGSMITDHSKTPLDPKNRDLFSSFVTYNKRRKTISVTKQRLCAEKGFLETPESCFYDAQLNAYELLKEYCRFNLPSIGSIEEYINSPPPFIFQFHPSLGPVWEIIGQKIRGGTWREQSELVLEIAEVDIENIILKGTLKVIAKEVMGSRDAGGHIKYNHLNGKCTLKNVTVDNHGFEHTKSTSYWDNQITRSELLEIILEGNGEFYAENVTFRGNQQYVVPDGHLLQISEVGGKLVSKLTTIIQPTWQWKYHFDGSDAIKLTKSK